jgi:DNA-binding response OmpR family regulator
MNVLVVDDCASIRLVASKHLREWGFEPIVAKDAFEAYDLMETDQLPRLLIIDWVMPKMEGPELIREIRKRDPDRNIYIIMLTGKSGQEVLETAFRCGADDYLPKPIVADELYRRVCEGRNILERQDAVLAAEV